MKETIIPKEGVINTGKVLIGLRYEPVRRVEIGRDMYRLQSALLGQRRRISPGFVVWALAIIGVVILIASR